MEFQIRQNENFCRIFGEIRQKNSTKFMPSEIRQNHFVETFCRIVDVRTCSKWKGPRTCYLTDSSVSSQRLHIIILLNGEVKEKLPNNSGGNKLKWDPQTRMLLLNTCLDKEVWTARHGESLKGNLFRMCALFVRSFPTTKKILKQSPGARARLSLKQT